VLLRIVLVESLADAVAIALPIEGPSGDTPPDQSVASCIRSLRTLETADWEAFFEEVSATERILREDPAGVYARMDFDPRDRYRKAVEELAGRSDWSEEGVAREAIRRSSEGMGGRSGHVGYHLIDAGFDALGRAVVSPRLAGAMASVRPSSSDLLVHRRLQRLGRRARRCRPGAARTTTRTSTPGAVHRVLIVWPPSQDVSAAPRARPPGPRSA
jgi:hypothetical protein